MKIRFIIYMILFFIIHFLCFYYVLCFCDTYVNSSNSWAYSLIQANIIDYCGIKLVFPLVKTTLRQIIIWSKWSYVIKIYNLWIKLMAYMKPKRI